MWKEGTKEEERRKKGRERVKRKGEGEKMSKEEEREDGEGGKKEEGKREEKGRRDVHIPTALKRQAPSGLIFFMTSPLSFLNTFSNCRSPYMIQQQEYAETSSKRRRKTQERKNC